MLKSTNVITSRQNRFNPDCTYQKHEFKTFDLINGLKSKNLNDLKFTNLANNESENVFNMVFEMLIKHQMGDNSYLDDFVMDEIYNNYRSDRLFDIINRIQKTKYKDKDLLSIRKLNCKLDPNLHFYIKISKNNAKVILIDLYHLAIYGDLIKNNKRITIPIEKLYRRHRKNSVSLERLLDL